MTFFNSSVCFGLMQSALQQPLKERNEAFCAAFPTPLALVELLWPDGKLVKQVVALHADEIPALITALLEPRQNWLAPSSPFDWDIRVSEISAEELTEDERMPGQRARPGCEKDHWRKLKDRFIHLKSLNLEEVLGWVWHGVVPYPLIAGGSRYYARKSEHFINDDDRWFDLPFRNEEDRAIYWSGLRFAPPDRFALTHASGLMQAFDVNHGFIGPDDFRWLRVLPTGADARATFEGVRDSDLRHAADDSNDFAAEIPRVTKTHCYGPSRQGADLIRITPEGHALLPNNAMSDPGSAHVISLLAREDQAFSGPWRASANGIDSFGPEIDRIKAHWWGFGLHDRHNPDRWWILPRGTGKFAAVQLDAMPEIGPLSEILIGSIGGKFGALDIHTGEVLIPFVHSEWEELMFSPQQAVVFTDADGKHTAYDEFGVHLLGPLKTFELDKALWPSWMRPFWPEGKIEAEKRQNYIRHDIGEMVVAARRRRKFGDLNPFAPTLAAYTGRFSDGRKDADMCGLWMAPVEVICTVESNGSSLRKGQKGRVSFGDAAPYGASSMFNWLQELPVEGLVDGHPGRVVGVPFAALRVRKDKPLIIRRLGMMMRRAKARLAGRRR